MALRRAGGVIIKGIPVKTEGMRPMKRVLAIATLGVMMSLAVPAAAECVRPGEPDLPDGATATKETMIAAVKAVRAYQKELVTFRECLDSERAAAGEEATEEQLLTWTRRYNASVDAEEAFVNRFNEEIRAYKNKTASTK